MSTVRFIGLDVHADTIAVAVADPDGDVRSLGVIPNGEVSLPLDRKAASDLAQGALAISLEPSGGSPTGLPTGPVLYSGPVLPAG